MAKIKELAHGVWQLDYRAPDGSRPRPRFPSKALAEIEWGKIQKELQARKYKTIIPIKFFPMLQKYLDLYASVEKKRSWETTDKVYVERLKTFFGDVPLTSIGHEHIMGFKRDLLAKKLKPSTVNRHMSCLRMVCKMAILWGYMAKPSPMDGVKDEDEDNVVDNSLEVEEAQTLLKNIQVEKGRNREHKEARKKLWYLIQLAILLGIRKNQLRMLRKSDVNFSRDQYRVIKQKKKKNVAIIHPLPAAAKKLLLDYLEEFKPEGDYFFNYKWESTWKRLQKRMGLEKRVRWHDLRHTCATWVGELTGDLRVVQDLLSHENINTTQRYSHVTDRRQRAAARMLDNLWAPGMFTPEPIEEKAV